jgi:hypothetical protein
MENFIKINTLFKELNDELVTLKNDLENDINYSVSHAEIITTIETAEDSLHDAERQLHDIEHDVDVMNDAIEERLFSDGADDDDNAETKMYSRVDNDNDD